MAQWAVVAGCLRHTTIARVRCIILASSASTIDLVGVCLQRATWAVARSVLGARGLALSPRVRTSGAARNPGAARTTTCGATAMDELSLRLRTRIV